MATNFETVFRLSEVSRANSTFLILFFAGLISVIITALSLKTILICRNNSKKLEYLAILIVWSLFAAMVAWRSMPVKHPDLSNLCKSVEGIVHVLHVQPKEGHDRGDIITIAGEEIEIQRFVAWEAYKQTIAHGGFLTEGTYARVFWRYDDPFKSILQIDVDKSRSRALPIPKEATDHQNCGCCK